MAESTSKKKSTATPVETAKKTLVKRFVEEGIESITINSNANGRTAVVKYPDNSYFVAPLTYESTPQEGDVLDTRDLDDYIIEEVRSKTKKSYLTIIYVG